MAKKSSVYFGPPLAELTERENHDSAHDSVSGRINRAAERYLAILRRHGIDLTDEERNILGNVLSGTWADPLLIRHLADEVEDSEFDAPNLVAKLRSASFADLVATVDNLGF